MNFKTIQWVGDSPGFVRMVEQTLLPQQFVEVDIRTVEEMVDAIYRLAVRGAPAIGVAAAFGVLLGVQDCRKLSSDSLISTLDEVCSKLAAARPTAVNLFWALDRMQHRAQRDFEAGLETEALLEALQQEAQSIFESDVETCRRMGEHGAELIQDGQTILTHCNAGALATAGCGTALAPIYQALADGKRVAVWADETRPLLQGARLTSWELLQAGIEVTLITDNTAGSALRAGRIDCIFVGSDRIARNGDVCNKIGTYPLAVLAREHNVPFYVVAPLSTFDPNILEGADIPIEERNESEVTDIGGQRVAPEGVGVYNPAFDVTPAKLVAAIVTETGVIKNPDQSKVEAVLRSAGRIE